MHDADKEDALLVAITRDDKVFFGTDLVKPDDLTQKIKDAWRTGTDKTRLSKADMRAKFGWVVAGCGQRSRGWRGSTWSSNRSEKVHGLKPPPGSHSPAPNTAPTGGQCSSTR